MKNIEKILKPSERTVIAKGLIENALGISFASGIGLDQAHLARIENPVLDQQDVQTALFELVDSRQVELTGAMMRPGPTSNIPYSHLSHIPKGVY